MKALLRGYVLFDVNGRKFLRYSRAKAACHAALTTEPVAFTGLHVFKGWLGFFVRHVRATRPNPTVTYSVDAEL